MHGTEHQQLTGCVGTAGSEVPLQGFTGAQRQGLFLLGMVTYHRASATCSDIP